MEQTTEVLDVCMMGVPKFIAQPICKTDCEVRSMDDGAIEQTYLPSSCAEGDPESS